jgi:hypothetical protein
VIGIDEGLRNDMG